MKKRKAFSLIEMSVVILVIGVIIAGVMQATSMVNSSRLSSARSLTTNSRILEISGLVAWYETSLIKSLKPSENLNNSNISEWMDIGPDSSVTQKNKLFKANFTGLSLQQNGINSIPALKFQANASKISLSDFNQGSISQSTICAVFRPESVSSAMIYLDSYDAGSSSYSIGIKSNAVTFNAGNSTETTQVPYPASFAANNNYIVCTYITNSYAKAYVNDAIAESGNAAINAGSNPLKGLSIGADRFNNSGFKGLISEIIIFNRILQVPERKAVMEYLSKKYKIRVIGV